MKKQVILVLAFVFIITLTTSFASAGLIDWLKDLFGPTEDATLSPPIGCSDTDGDLSLEESYFVKGSVTMRLPSGISQGTVWDECTDANTLTEHICDGIPKKLTESCLNGCEDGACLDAIECIQDSDCGTDETTYSCSEDLTQSCVSTVSYQCINPGTEQSSCVTSGGGGCGPCTDGCDLATGKCIVVPPPPPPIGCSDTDGDLSLEESYFVKGSVTMRLPSGISQGTVHDKCNDANELTEYACVDELPNRLIENCLNGCEDGACLDAIDCTQDKDCGPTETINFCNEDNTESCEETTQYTCSNPGTPESSCTPVISTVCSLCTTGCDTETGLCIPTPTELDLEVSVATLKDNYAIGEAIQLTDPPEPTLSNTNTLSETQFDFISQPEQLGYIVKLKEEPLLLVKEELTEKAEDNEQYIEEHPIISTITLQRFFALRPNDVSNRVDSHKNKLQSEKQKAKQKIRGKLSPSTITGRAITEQEFEDITISEFDNVFNGITLDITPQEAQEIEKIDEVEKISPNLLNELNLMDSVPLINADDVWQLQDPQGQDLTGQGMKIAIIDTGIDYLHSDLGCVGELCGTVLDANQQKPVINGDIVVWQDFSNGYGNLVMYDISTQVETKVTDDEKLQADFAVYGDLIAWTEGVLGGEVFYPQVMMYDISTNQKTQITTGIAERVDVDIYEDKIVWAEYKDGNFGIYMHDLSTGIETQLTSSTKQQRHPSIYEDKIVWSDNRNDGVNEFNVDVFMHDLSTGQELQITNHEEPQAKPKIYGDKIIWDDYRNYLPFPGCNPETEPRGCKVANVDVYMYELSTGQETQLTTSTRSQENSDIFEEMVVWEEMNFVRHKVDVWLLDLSTGQETRINSDESSGQFPRIDSNRVVWTDYRDSDFDVFMYDLSTNLERQLNFEPNIDPSELFPNSKIIGGYDFSDNDPDPIDSQGHGTHVSSTAAGSGILKGVAPDASILAYKVFPNAYDGVLISSIERAILDGADIISMSLGKDCNFYYGGYTEDCGPDDSVSSAVDNAVTSGVSVVISAGNSGPSPGTIGSPGTARKAITIGATDKSDNIASFSSRGPVIWQTETIIKPDITAPGVNICAAQYQIAFSGNECLDNEHVAISGTSMAAPHVAGAAALLKQSNPSLSPQEIKDILKNTAIDLGLDENTQGSGRIDILAAIDSLAPPRPQSKVVNNENTNVAPTLLIVIQQQNFDEWEIYPPVSPIEQEVTIPANNLIKLDSIFNPLNIAINEAGNYRVHVSLRDSEGNILHDLENAPLEASWEFTVS
jgi:beta propeller repeat protein